jgi:transcriptional regulator with XRE-family HTH domain
MPKRQRKKTPELEQVRERLLRVRAPLSQQDFARRLGISQQRLSHIERRGLPSADFYMALVRAGYSLDWLFTGQGQPRRTPAPRPKPLFTSPYPEFHEFLADPQLSGSATFEELQILDRLRFGKKGPPSKYFYYWKLQQLRRSGRRA